MKKIVCVSSNHVLNSIKGFLFGIDETRISINPDTEKEEYLIIELVNDISALQWFEAAARWLREKGYSEKRHAYEIVGVNTYGIALYEEVHLAGKDVSVFIPWSNIAGVHNHTEEELVEMERKVESLPFLEGEE